MRYGACREKDSSRKVVDHHRRQRADPCGAPTSSAAEQLRRSIPGAREDSQRDAYQEQADEHDRPDRAHDFALLQPTAHDLDRGQDQSDREDGDRRVCKRDCEDRRGQRGR